jgi:hypothetical protein
MHLRYALVAPLLAAGLVLVAQPVHAGRSVPVARPVSGTPHQLQLGSTGAKSAVCRLGVPGEPAYIVSYAIPPEDQYYTLLEPSECECGAGGVLATTAHVVLDFTDTFSNPVRVGIVAADLSNPSCPVPIPGQYLCPPVEYALAGPDAGIYDVSLPLFPGCCFTGPAFLEFTFVDWNEWWSLPPNLVLTGECDPCTSYNYYPGAHYDLCSFGFEGNPIMYVDAACCGVVPVRSDSWGRLKTLYR